MRASSATPLRRAWLVLATGAATAAAASRELVSIADQMMHEETVDADEYLWETLPGRCCFNELADDCDTCSVWSDPENYCHMSRDNCEHCGMSLYCDPPPPLLDANKVCIGNSKVGVGCEDDLDTGICKRKGALQDCQAVCRRTEHCEMIVLYIDQMTGTCVLCRNLLNYEQTGLALTRIYAVEYLAIEPPSPPGYIRETVKHFSVIKDPSPPPPPRPPPEPPHSPPPPLPAHLGTRTDTHIECSFEEDTDYSVSADATGSYTDLKADTQKHCCSLCGMQPGCTDFVYEPSSKTCVLLPHVPSSELIKSHNPSTVAGSVFISHVSNYHASCEFDVASGYSGGSLGMGTPLSGMKITTKQDCCDACERDETCAKFTFEKFSGTCEIFSAFSEHYFTSGLLSGTVDGRTHVGPAVDEAKLELGVPSATLELPPAPPTFLLSSLKAASPPPAELDVAKRVVADLSLTIGFIMIFGLLVCSYCFFSPQLQAMLFSVSGGKLGKAPRSLLPTHSNSEETKALTHKKRKRQKLEPGWARVTVQTSQLTQNKDVEVEGCETLADVRTAIWEEFGHLLAGFKRPAKDTIVLCIPGSDGRGHWQLVSESSDIARVVACGTLKLMEKSLLDVDSLEVAFALNLPAPKKRGGRRATKMLTQRSSEPPPGEDGSNDEDDDEDDDDDDDDADQMMRGREGRNAKGGFEPLAAAGSSDEDESSPSGKAGSGKASARQKARGQARSARKQNKGKEKKEAADADADDGDEVEAKHSKEAPGHRSHASARAPQMEAASPDRDDISDIFEREASKKPAAPSRAATKESQSQSTSANGGGGGGQSSNELLGRQVRIHGLTSMGDLNGRTGLAKSFDQAKQRYRVQLKTGGGTKTLAFKQANLQLMDS